MGAAQRVPTGLSTPSAVGRTLTAYLAGLELDRKSVTPARAGVVGRAAVSSCGFVSGVTPAFLTLCPRESCLQSNVEVPSRVTALSLAQLETDNASLWGGGGLKTQALWPRKHPR